MKVSLRSGAQLHRPLLAAALFAAVITVIAVGGLVIDDRVLVGVPIWQKAMKFGVSITIYTLTIAWLLRLLDRGRRAAWWLGTVIAAAITVELVLIVVQILRGRMSHFNTATIGDTAIFYAMGGFIASVWFANLVLGIVLALQRIPDRTVAAGIRAGTVVALIGMAVALLMVVGELGVVEMHDNGIAGAHTVGAADGGPSLPIAGWSTVAGDLRVPHFIGIHALQALPLLAMAFSWFGGAGGCLPKKLPVCGWCAWAAAVTWVFSLSRPGRQCADSPSWNRMLRRYWRWGVFCSS